MLKSSARSAIRLRGVRHNNLKGFDLDLPLRKLIVLTGLSGSGKSSLAFDTLFAEGQRRYIETFSPYARQFFDRMDKPRVDSIEGIPPAIAIEQRNAVRTTRSTVGTMTEICDYMKVVWSQIAQLHCRQCGQPVRKESPQSIWSLLTEAPAESKPDQLVTFDLPLSEKLSLEESLALVARQGYQRLLVKGQIVRLEDASASLGRRRSGIAFLTVIQDRLKLSASNRHRFVEACEQAYHFGKGKLQVWEVQPSSVATSPRPFSNRLHCARCDLEYRESSPALFSFNHPLGACPACRGFGRIISIDYNLALPDCSKTLAEGVVKPWQIGHGLESQTDLLRMCRHFEIPTDVPFNKLPEKWQKFVIEGDPDYGKDEEHQWPRAWYGVKGYFRWLESKAYKMHVRVLLSRYRTYTTCPDCQGRRFQPESLLYRFSLEKLAPRDSSTKSFSKTLTGTELGSLTLADFYQLPIRDALALIEQLCARPGRGPHDPLMLVLGEVRARLAYLEQVGLGYLALDRPTRSLSGGETERVNLTTCLGTRLVNTLFVLDEPSVGLHPRDTERLVRILEELRDAGNTVIVVEHEASVMRAADQIVDLGPGHGATGGEVVFQGSYASILRADSSLTGQYLSGRKQIEVRERRPVAMAVSASATYRSRSRFGKETRNTIFGAMELNDASAAPGENPDTVETLRLVHATRHNLKDLSVEIPLRRLVCVTGVSGSGKTTLVRELLLPLLDSKLNSAAAGSKASERFSTEENQEETDDSSGSPVAHSPQLEGWEVLDRVILVDQSILGKTPRSNPAVYIGAFDDIRELFAQSEPARRRGLNASAFSFNSAQGQCERCRGAGFEKIEMQFLSDVFIRCPDCNGRRYRRHILEVRIHPKHDPGNKGSRANSAAALSIADVLESTVEEAIAFLERFPDSRPGARAAQRLKLLEEVGLGYLKLGQPINTLSGGECQRLKLVSHLAESGVASAPDGNRSRFEQSRRWVAPASPGSTLFLFDEPTTGLHFDDVRLLLKVFQRLVDAGHSVVVIEHNLEVLKAADWIIDLGPDAGDRGGRLVTQGTPEQVAACAASHTGRALREVLPNLVEQEIIEKTEA